MLTRLVDVATYIANLYAEYTKERYGNDRSHCLRIQIEVIIPAIAVLTLLVITGLVLQSAVDTILHNEEEETVKISYLYVFSLLNLFVDVCCVIVFASRGSSVLYEEPPMPMMSMEIDMQSDDSGEFGHLEDEFDRPNLPPPSHFGVVKNLNMRSALTHVVGDSLRTVSVLGAAVVSSITRISPDICDAWAAVAVSVTIILAILPLMADIARTGCKLCTEIRQSQREYTAVGVEDDHETNNNAAGDDGDGDDDDEGSSSNITTGKSSGIELSKVSSNGTAVSTSNGYSNGNNGSSDFNQSIDDLESDSIFEFSSDSQLKVSPRGNSFNL